MTLKLLTHFHIFFTQVDNIKFGESDGGQGGYVSWKPVVYTQKSRDVTDGKMVSKKSHVKGAVEKNIC